MKDVRLKVRNGKVLVFHAGIWYTEEAMARIHPRAYTQMFNVPVLRVDIDKHTPVEEHEVCHA